MMILKLRFESLILLLIIFFCGQTLAQENDSIIHIDEVTVQNNKNPSIVKVKTEGTRNEIRGFNKPNSKFVSLVNNLPKGQLSSVSFFFSPGMLTKGIEYDLGLLIYESDANGKPGKPVSDKDIRFKLKSNGKGKIELDLGKLFLNSEEKLFFGFAIYNDLSRNPLLVKHIESKSAVSFYKELGSDWLSPVADIPIHLKLIVEVDPDK